VIKIAIVGTGGMAHAHALAYQAIRGCRLVAACDVVEERATAFAEEFGIPSVHTDVDEMLRDVEIDAVSNVTPDAFHAPLSLKAIAAGKHVLCEKPLAVSYGDARRMARAAARQGVINMVNFSYRNSSAIHRAHRLVQQGRIGRVLHVEASYLQSWLSSKVWGDWRASSKWLWRLSRQHGSKGVLGDIGVHIVDFATYPAGEVRSVSCRLKTYSKAPGERIGEYKLDANDSAVISAELANGALAVIHTTRWATGHGNSIRLRIFGDKGAVVVDLDEATDALRLCSGPGVDSREWKTVRCAKTPTIYQRFIRSVKSGVNDQPDFARGAAVQKVLDACFESDSEGRRVRL